ncbi:unnamed protein product [Blepharisma stoltei]|uniref:Ribose 5-phosphate isomerase B n=1 Tax=Blepharisma stoltei TaxID=1481888 RepID=A0AAU9KCI5_9CILI|nr:unnamed protein product [Blepharisma stoltei]
MENITIAVGCDHEGHDMKVQLVQYLSRKGISVIDVGTNNSTNAVDYPVYAKLVCDKVLSGEAQRGLLICESGIGMSMAANRFKGIRCAVCHDYFGVLMTREHNDCNVLALGGKVIGIEVAKQVVDTYLSTRFLSEHPNHPRRVDLLNSYP